MCEAVVVQEARDVTSERKEGRIRTLAVPMLSTSGCGCHRTILRGYGS